MKIEIGARVAYVMEKKPLLGTVINNPDSYASVLLDKSKEFNRNAAISMPTGLITPVNILYKPRSLKEEGVKPTDKSPLQLFMQKGSKKFDLIVARGMWSWVNFNLFHGKLQHYPIFTDKPIQDNSNNIKKLKKLDPTGLCYMKGSEVHIYLKMNAFINVYAMWSTLVHEMVHQYCFETKTNDGHGPNFTRWSTPVKEICKVELTQYHYQDTDAFEEEEEPENKDIVPEFFVLIIGTAGVYLGIASKNLDLLREVRSQLPPYYKFYFRRSTSYNVYRYMGVIKSSKFKDINAITKVVPHELANTLIKEPQYQLQSSMLAKLNSTPLLVNSINL